MMENKQKFISQIMTSKAPVRSFQDFDESVLSYAEIKSICVGNPELKEMMDLKIQVAKLQLLKADYNSQKYRMEDDIYKRIPAKIKKLELEISNNAKDILLRDANVKKLENKFSMVINDIVYDKKEDAGQKTLETCSKISISEEYKISRYLGFDMSIYRNLGEYSLHLKCNSSYSIALTDDIGNAGVIMRINNALSRIEQTQSNCKNAINNLNQQFEDMQAEIKKPFHLENELQGKSLRLKELTIKYNSPNNSINANVPSNEKQSILEKLKLPNDKNIIKSKSSSEISI